MEKGDLRNKIIQINNNDLIYLDTYEEQYNVKKTNSERMLSATDFAKMNNSYIFSYAETNTGKETTLAWLNSEGVRKSVEIIGEDGEFHSKFTSSLDVGICPSLQYKIGTENSALKISEVKNINNKTIGRILEIGEYPKTKVDEGISKTLEDLYHFGKPKEGLIATGRWYSGNGQVDENKGYAGKHSPEFVYQDQKYVRVISSPNRTEIKYSDGTIAGERGTVRWVKVEPISFEIKNWEKMPIYINPNGDESANSFDLRTQEVITANIPFYPYEDEIKSNQWENSTIRGFLNGKDVKGGSFKGECNFLNEAFNLSREPITEYAIPESEYEIPDDAFNGCILLKKIVIPPSIRDVGKRAFEGLSFKCAYKTEDGYMVLSQELPQNKQEYIYSINLEIMEKVFEGFDYTVIFQKQKFAKFAELARVLVKNKFKIPYIYGLQLIENEKINILTENTDFRFFKNELTDINEKLLEFSEDEKNAFFKFATVLGCFNTEKILDKFGNPTNIICAQKASSLLAKLLRTNEIELRKIF